MNIHFLYKKRTHFGWGKKLRVFPSSNGYDEVFYRQYQLAMKYNSKTLLIVHRGDPKEEGDFLFYTIIQRNKDDKLFGIGIRHHKSCVNCIGLVHAMMTLSHKFFEKNLLVEYVLGGTDVEKNNDIQCNRAVDLKLFIEQESREIELALRRGEQLEPREIDIPASYISYLQTLEELAKIPEFLKRGVCNIVVCLKPSIQKNQKNSYLKNIMSFITIVR